MHASAERAGKHVGRHTCVVVEHNVVPLVPWLQQHLTLLGHLAHVDPLILAVWRHTQHVQLVHKGCHIDERIIIGLQHKLDVVAGDSILQDEVCFVQDGLVVGLMIDKDYVPMLLDLLCYLQCHGCGWDRGAQDGQLCADSICNRQGHKMQQYIVTCRGCHYMLAANLEMQNRTWNAVWCCRMLRLLGPGMHLLHT